ncbi:hypothetical protein TNCV_852601 [Trichonephila clavipes]|nr:hypothetical protein TNCV_852601 [Trichonephila clavipes]
MYGLDHREKGLVANIICRENLFSVLIIVFSRRAQFNRCSGEVCTELLFDTSNRLFVHYKGEAFPVFTCKPGNGGLDDSIHLDRKGATFGLPITPGRSAVQDLPDYFGGDDVQSPRGSTGTEGVGRYLGHSKRF